MRSILPLLAIPLVLGMGCSKKPDALTVCQQLEAGGVATNCRKGTPEGLGIAAIEKAEFDLPSVPAKGGMVLRFEDDEKYDKTVSAFSGAAVLAGPHRYGSRTTRIFVQMNSGAPAEVGAKAKAVVDALPDEDKSPPVSKAPAAAAPASAGAATPASAAAPAATPQPAEVCTKLEAGGVAKNCTKTDTGVKFDIEGVAAKGAGSVVAPGDEKTFGKYLAAVEASPPTSPLRPFVSSSKARIVVHLSKGVTPAVQAKAKGVVDAL